jgi:ABC-2 type transport system permease protein
MVANAKANLPLRDQILPEIEKRLLAEYNVQRVEDLPIDPKRVANIELDAAGDRIQEEIFNRLHDAYDAQDAVYQTGSVLAPGIAVQSLSMALSETHFAHYRLFADAAEAYRQELVHTMDQADLHSENAKPGAAGPIVQDRETWEKLRPFEYTSPGFAWSLGKSFISIIVLIVWFAGTAILTPLAVLRLKVD